MNSLTRLTLKLSVRLLRVTVMLLLIAAFGVGLLLFNPHWLVGMVQSELAYRGIDAEISRLAVNFSGTTYRLQGDVQANSKYGVHVQNAHLDATIDWYAIWQRKPFIVQANLRDANVVIDKNLLNQQIKKNPGQRGQMPDLSSVFPLNWTIENSRLSIDGHQLNITANGQQDTHVDAVIADDNSGEITANYAKNTHRLTLNSQQMDLAALTGYAAILRNAKATINTQNWFDSELLTELEYQNILSDVSITQSAGRIHVVAKAVDKVAKAEIALQGDKTTVYFDDLDLAIYELIKPLIPVKLNISDLAGRAAGQFTLEKQNLSDAELKLTGLQLSHPTLITDNVDAEITLKNGIVGYHVVLDNSELLLPTVFEQDSNRLSGQIAGRVDLDERSVAIRELTLNGSDFEQLTTSGTVQWDSEKRSVLLDIKGELHNADIAKNRRYLPYQMPSKTRSWLGDALVSGNQNSTRFTLSGDPKTYKNDGFQLRIETDFKDSVFHYLKDNPNIHFQSGKFAMDGRKLWVSSDKALVGGLPFTAQTTIENVLETQVDIQAKMQHQAAKKMLAVAKKSIAKQAIHDVEKIVKPDGDFDLDLAILLNIYDRKIADTFDIVLRAKNASATLLAYPELPLSNATTEVKINRQGLQQLTADGQMQGKPFNVVINTDKNQYNVGVKGTANAITTLRKLKILNKKQSDTLQKANLISGQSVVSSDITLNHKGELQTVAVQSDLHGTRLNVFSALQKSAQGKLPLRLTYDAKKRFIDANVGQATLQTHVGKNGSIKGFLLNNQVKKTSYQNGKLQLYWQSEQFDYPTFNRFRQAIAPSSEPSTLPYHIDLKIKAVKLPNDKSYAIDAVGDENSIHINSPILRGVFDYQGERLHGNIQRLAVDELFQLSDKMDVNPAGREVKKLGLEKALPPLTLVAEKVFLKGKNIGNASLRTSENKGHYSIDQFLLSGKDYYIELSGYEATEPHPRGMTTHIQADFKGENLRNVTQALSLNDVIDARSLDVSLTLSWPGKAHTLNIEQSYGEGALTAQNLKMLNIDAGLGGLFGLIDITGILKRVTLDFKNVTSSKIAFDSINGKWNIGGGRAMTRKFYAEGSVIAMELSGPVDLYRREFDDLKMTVIPRTSNVLPVVGAVAGGVVGSAIGLAVKQVLGKHIDSAIGLPYVISGTWENPIVTFRGETEPDGNSPEKTTTKVNKQTPEKSASSATLPEISTTAEGIELESITIDLNTMPTFEDSTPILQTKPDEPSLKEWIPESDWTPTLQEGILQEGIDE